MSLRSLCVPLLLGFFWLIAGTPDLHAQNKRIEITDLRVGYPAGTLRSGTNLRGDTIYKRGQWAPIWVGLECFKDTDPNEPPEKLMITVSTQDDDKNWTEATVTTNPMVKGEVRQGYELGPVPMLKFASQDSEIRITVRSEKTKRTLATLERSVRSIDLRNYVILGVGNNLASLSLNTPNNRNQNDDRGSGVDSAVATNVGYMPDHWFGYNSVEMVVLTTGNRAFWEQLSQDANRKRREALIEWVRRGGNLIISAGLNPDLFASVPDIAKLLPGTMDPTTKKQVPQVSLSSWSSDSGAGGTFTMIGDEKNPIFVTPLKPFTNRTRYKIASTNQDDMIVQAAFGMGRVTYVGFDLDRPPFVEANNRANFWTRLLTASGPALPSPGDRNSSYMSDDETAQDYSNVLQGSLDFFEGTPPISFGWVALFIFIYIVLIGPIDYIILKKVIRRLEWTWVTFPLIVILTSTAAYFAAYYLKGRDLKINKVDVVDLDLSTKRIEGHTWFTLFGPRSQKYKVGIEPAGPEGNAPNVWTPDTNEKSLNGTLVSWQGRLDRSDSRGGGGLFDRSYTLPIYTDPADLGNEVYSPGLNGVPINVWTTKTFQARWSANLDAEKPPFNADLRRGNENTLQGTITNNTGIEQFTDIAIIWRGKVRDLGKEFPKNSSKDINLPSSGFDKIAVNVSDWLNSQDRWSSIPYRQPTYTGYGRGGSNPPEGTPSNPNFRLWRVLFHNSNLNASTNTNTGRNEKDANATLRHLDQSWRVQNEKRDDFAILVLRVPTREGAAEDMTQDPASPSRLWLGAIPSENPDVTRRPSLQGFLKQETYIRVIIPVKNADK